jgi:hypothetical protein
VIVSQIEQVLELPITFLGGFGAGIGGVGGVSGSFGCVGSGVNSMTSNMGGCCIVTGGTGGGASSCLIGRAAAWAANAAVRASLIAISPRTQSRPASIALRGRLSFVQSNA